MDCPLKTEAPRHTDPPKCIRMVVLTALKDNIQELSEIGGLGANELMVGASRYAMATPSNFADFQFKKDGLELIQFTKDQLLKLQPLKNLSSTLPRDHNPQGQPEFIKLITQFNQNEHRQLQAGIDDLALIVKEWYEKNLGTRVIVVPSRNIVPRAAGCQHDKCVIPGNPMMHLDYFNFEDAYNAQCDQERQTQWNEINEKYGVPAIKINSCPDKNNLLDVINLWFPTEDVRDWPLAFMPDIEETKYTKVQIISGSIAASVPLRKIPAEAKIVYKDEMKWGDAYIFRSATGPDKKAVLHGSIRITNENFIRRSYECRFLIFKDTSAGGGDTITFWKNKKKYTRKILVNTRGTKCVKFKDQLIPVSKLKRAL